MPQSKDPSDELPNKDTSRIRALEQTVAAALMNGEFTQYADMVDERFCCVSLTGLRFHRDDFVEHLKTMSRIHLTEIREMEVVIEGDIAIVTADWFVNMVEGSTHLTGLTRITRNWVRRPTGWKMIQLHVSDARVADTRSAIQKKDNLETL